MSCATSAAIGGGELAGERAQRRAGRFARRRVDEIGDPFGLREIELALEERAAREFARLGEARAGVEAGVEQRLHHDRAAVALQLQHRLAGIGMRRREVESDALVDASPANRSEGRQPRLGQAAEDRSRDPRHFGPETRTTPIPPRPAGVAIAAMVSGSRTRCAAQRLACAGLSRSNMRWICHCCRIERMLFTSQ